MSTHPILLLCLAASATCLSGCTEPPSAASLPGCPDTPARQQQPYRNWCGVEKIRRFVTRGAAEKFVGERDGVRSLVLDGNDVLTLAPTLQPHPGDEEGSPIFTTPSPWGAHPNYDYVDPADELYSLDIDENKIAMAYELTQDLLAVNHRVWNAIGAKAPTQLIPFTRRPKVAVIDTGIYAHPEFSRRGPSGYSLTHWYDADPAAAGPGCAGGYCCREIAQPEKMSSHATQVAGLISADDDNAGISGLGETAELMSIRILEVTKGCFSRKRLVAGFECAVQQNADIINISMQSERGQQCPRDLYKAMLQDSRARPPGRGPALIVLAAGNRGCDLCKDDCRVWPGAIELPWTITVEALELNGQRVKSSNYGKSADLAVPAPTDELLCTTTSENPSDPNTRTCTNGYSRFAETSAAAALVTGAATRVWGHPNFDRCSATQIRRILRGFGKPLQQDGSPSCQMQIDFLYDDVARDDEGNAIDLCACPEMNAGDACGDLREQAQLCRSGAPKKRPQPWRNACDGPCEKSR